VTHKVSCSFRTTRESVNRSQMDIKRKTCDIQTWWGYDSRNWSTSSAEHISGWLRDWFCGWLLMKLVGWFADGFVVCLVVRVVKWLVRR
jgi:hypothetical protein